MNILFQYTKINLQYNQIKANPESDDKLIEHKQNEPTKNTGPEPIKTKKLFCPKPVVPEFCCPDPNIPTLCCPRLKILHNFKTGTCWVISLLHNIRANKLLHDFILKNCQNENFFQQLEVILNFEKREITHEEWKLLNTFCTTPLAWKKGGNPIMLIEGMLSYIKCQKNDDFKAFHDEKANDFQNIATRKDIYKLYKYHDIPYYTIYTGMFPISGYINVANALRGRPNNSQLNDTNIQDTVCFGKAEDFIILNSKECMIDNVCHLETGITIQKDIYINVKGETQQQKYSLTGILLNETPEGRSGHTRAFIKCNYQWYDTDYEMIKSSNGRFKQGQNYDFFLDLKNQFKSEISIGYTDPLEYCVCAVFYQKVV